MKKTGKLAVLILILAMLCAVFAVTSSADYKTNVLLNKDCSTGGTASGTVHVNEADGNSYLSYRYVKTPDVYDFGCTVNNAFNGDWEYITVDYDMMTETTYESGNGTKIYIMTRNGGGSPLGIDLVQAITNADGTAKIKASKSGAEYSIPSGTYAWAHYTHVLMLKHEKTAANEVKNDKSVVLTFVNGQFAFSQTGVIRDNSVNITGFRLQSLTKTESDATVCVDNVRMTMLGKGYDGNLTRLFDGNTHTLDEDTYDVAYHKGYKLPFGKKRAGVFNLAGYETVYDNMQAAFDTAKDGYELKLYDDVKNVTIANGITVDTNGHNFSWIPGNFAVTETVRNGSKVYSFQRTDRFAYFTFYPEGPDGAPDGEDIAVPIGATPVYTGKKLKADYEDDSGYYVFKEWRIFGETPVSAVTAGDVDSYYDLYPAYESAKADPTGTFNYRNDCEKSGLSVSSTTAAASTFSGSGLVKVAGNNYYRYFAVLDAAGNSNPVGTSAYLTMPYGMKNLSDLSYFTIEFDIATEDIPAGGSMTVVGRNAAGSPYGAKGLYFANENGKLKLTLDGQSTTIKAGEWAHVTIVAQSRGTNSDDVSAVLFVNGERVATVQNYWDKGQDRIKIDDLRLNVYTTNPAGSTLCFDNVALQTFAKSYNGSLSKLFSDNTTDLNKKIYRDVLWYSGYERPFSGPAARVDGVEYDGISAALKALPQGGTLELLRDLTTTLTIDRPMTVVTNGYAFAYAKGIYDVATPLTGTYVFTETTKIAYFTFYNIDGSVLVADAPVTLGNLPEPGVAFSTAVQDADGSLRVFVAWLRDGKPLSQVTEAEIDGHFEVYPQTGTVTDYSALIYDKDKNLTVVRREADIATAMASAKPGSTFIFNCDYYIAKTIKINGLYVDLNGHTISSNGKADVEKYNPFQLTGETSYFYSSKKGGYLRISPVVIDGKEQSYAAKNSGTPATFTIEAPVVLGTVYNPVMKETYDGDNFIWSGGCFINTYTASFTIDGGHYFAVLNDYAAPINSRASLKDIHIRNAEFYSNRKLFAFQNAKDAEIFVENCKIFLTSGTALMSDAVGASGAAVSGTLYLSDTAIYGGNVNVAGSAGHIVIGANCSFSSMGTYNTTLGGGLVLASRTAKGTFSPELLAFLGTEGTWTTNYCTATPEDLITVVWQDGKRDQWLPGTTPTHETAGGQIVVDGWLCKLDGTWVFKDAKGQVLTFETLPEELIGKTVYAEAAVTKVKEVYASLTYGTTTEYFYTNDITVMANAMLAAGQVKSNGAVILTFHRDISAPTSKGLNIGNKDNQIPIYVDLNGHTVQVKEDFLSVKGSTGYFIYSSQRGGTVRTAGSLAYNYSRNYSVFYVGTVTTPDGTTHDGANLTVYARRLFSHGTWVAPNTSPSYVYTYRLNGGTYYLSDVMFATDQYASIDATIENASVYAKAGAFWVQSGRTATLTVKNSALYFAKTASFAVGSGTGTLNFIDSAVYGVGIGHAKNYTLTLSGNIKLSHIPLSPVTLPAGSCFAHAPAEKVVFGDYDGVEQTYYAACGIAKISDCLAVEWKNGDTTVKDYWLPGTRLEFLLSATATLDTEDDRYAYLPNGWTFLLNGGLLTDPTVEDWMAGATVTATPRIDRVPVAFYIVLPNGSVDVYTATDFDTFRSALQSAAKGSRVVMHTDYLDIPASTIDLAAGELEIDMNGHVITSTWKLDNGNIFRVMAGASAYIYSSAPGACLTSTTGGFTIRAEGKLYLGVTKDGKTFDRANLVLRGTCGVQVIDHVVLKSITYLAENVDNVALFQGHTTDVRLTIDNCVLVNTTWLPLFGMRTAGGFNVTVNDSVILLARGGTQPIALTAMRDDACNAPAKLTLTNTTLLSASGWTVKDNFPVTIGDGCTFATSDTVANTSLATDMVYARVAPRTLSVTVLGNSYGGEICYQVCRSTETATVEWKQTAGASVSEIWKKGEIPSRDTVTETADKYISYVYRVETALTENIVVEPTRAFLLPMKENLTLTANFNYNIYLPADASVVKRVTLNGKEFALSKTVTIDGVSYYVISYTDITPRDAMQDIAAVIYAEAADGTAFEKSVTLSIFGYAQKILTTDASAEAKQLIVDMLAYIRAAYCYFTPAAERDTARVDALLEGRTPSTPTYGTAVSSGDLSKVLYGASLSLDGTPAFAFRVRDDFRGTLKISYQNDNGDTVSADFDYTAGGNTYVLCKMSARDMRKTLTLKATDAEGKPLASGSYNLDTYILGVTGDLIPDFAARLYAYSVSCEAFDKANH